MITFERLIVLDRQERDMPNMDDQPLLAQIMAYTDDLDEISRLMDEFARVWPDSGVTFQSSLDESTGAPVTLFNVLQLV